MSTGPIIAPQSDSHRYEAVLRISEAIAACREPEDLAITLASEIGKFLRFEHLYFVVLKENSKEIEYLVWGKGPLPLPDLRLKSCHGGRLCAAGIHIILPIGTPKSGTRDLKNGQRK
jgi:hypothetical protein